MSLGQSRPFALVISVICALALTFSGCRPVPQVIDDPAVFAEVDALYTAVTSRRKDLLSACGDRLKKLHDEKRLSDPGFTAISDIVRQAEQGDWTNSASRLYNFMRAQRRSS